MQLMAHVGERSASLLKLAIQSQGVVWKTAKLDVVFVSEIPLRLNSIATLPSELTAPDENRTKHERVNSFLTLLRYHFT